MFLIFILLLTKVFAEDTIHDPDLEKAMPVLVDVATASVVANYGETKVYLPSMGISSSDAGLPTRISFFLTDPASFTKSISKALGLNNKDLFSAIISSFNSTVSDPLLTAVYYSLLAKNYQVGDYLISGNLLLSFPESFDDLTLEDLIDMNLNEGDPIILQSNLNIYGSKISKPVTIIGRFELRTDENNHFILIPVGEYIINNNIISGGEFRL